MPGGAAPVEGGPGFGACAGVKVAALAATTSRLAALAFSDRTIEIRSARAVGRQPSRRCGLGSCRSAWTGTLSGGAGADASGFARHGVEEGARNRRPRRPPATAMQVVAKLSQQRGNPWPAVKKETDHSALGALCCDLCECLLGVVGSTRRTQGGPAAARVGAPDVAVVAPRFGRVRTRGRVDRRAAH